MVNMIDGVERAALRNPLLAAFRPVEQQVASLRMRVRSLFYAVMLFQKACPECGESELCMVRDGLAVCTRCGAQIDPTITFQTCTECDSHLQLKVRHYWCPRCQRAVRSLYCIDTRVFDAAYFREKMQESRERIREKRERYKQTLHRAHADPILIQEPFTLDHSPGLEFDLNAIIASFVPSDLRDVVAIHFNLEVYRQHLTQLVSDNVVEFEGVSPLVKNRRLDRIFRFITAIFLEHEGILEIEQLDGGGLRLVGK